jgi:ribose-phosphate pyrophosphokinase
MITVRGFEDKFWTFPGGERSVKLTPNEKQIATQRVFDATPAGEWPVFEMRMDFKGSDDLVDMMLAVNALRNMYGHEIEISLNVPYFPFSRQDRVMTEGESFGLQVVVDMIKLCNFKHVITLDIHSDVAAALFPAGFFGNAPQDTVWANRIKDLAELAELELNGKTVIVSPDAGALKKIYKVAAATGLPVVEAKKIRDVATGHIVKTEIDGSQLSEFEQVVIVDDICDGGRTFVELGKVIRDSGFRGRLVLCVTHGIFSKGLDVFTEYFDEIHTVNNIGGVDLVNYNSSTR